MLEAMEEKQVTIEGITHKLPAPFVTMATQNPIEQEGTYPLPEAQMDRFLMKMSMGYPSMDEEKAILQRRKLRGKDNYDVEQIVEPRKVVAMQKALETVHIDPGILGYIVQVVQRTRADPRIEAGASPRASQGLFKASRASAAIDGRDYVIPDDVKYEQCAEGEDESFVYFADLSDPNSDGASLQANVDAGTYVTVIDNTDCPEAQPPDQGGLFSSDDNDRARVDYRITAQ